MPRFATFRPLTVVAVTFVIFGAAMSAGCSMSMPGAERPPWSLMESAPSHSPAAEHVTVEAGAL